MPEEDIQKKQEEQQIQSTVDAIKEANAQSEAALKASNAASEKSFAQMMLDYNRDYKDTIARDAALQAQEEKKAKFGATTEFLTSLANLVGVGGYGASPQTYKSYSQDWMQQAENNRKQRQAKCESLADKRRSLQQQLSALQSKNALSLANLRYQNKRSLIQAQRADAQASYQEARVARMEIQNEIDQLKEARAKETDKAKIENINSQIVARERRLATAEQRLQFEKDKWNEIHGQPQNPAATDKNLIPSE